MKLASRNLVMFTTLTLSVLTGCEDPKKRQTEVDQAINAAVNAQKLVSAEEQRRAVATAVAQAKADTLEELNRETKDARDDGYKAGHVAGRLEAQAEFALKLELEKEKAFKRGETAGELKAAAIHFEKGMAVGKESGVLEGRELAAKQHEAEKKLAVNEATGAAAKVARLEGMEEGREQVKREEVGKTNVPAIAAATVLICLMFFVLSRTYSVKEASARVLRNALDEERRRTAKLEDYAMNRSGVVRALPSPTSHETDSDSISDQEGDHS